MAYVYTSVQNGYADISITMGDLPCIWRINSGQSPLTAKIWVIRNIHCMGKRVGLRIAHFFLNAVHCQLSYTLAIWDGYHLDPNTRDYVFKFAPSLLMHLVHSVCIYTWLELDKETFRRGIATVALISGDWRRQRCQAEQQA